MRASQECQILKASYALQYSLRVIRMQPHCFPFRGGQFSWFVENIVRHAELSDVVQQSGASHQGYLIFRQRQSVANRWQSATAVLVAPGECECVYGDLMSIIFAKASQTLSSLASSA